MKQYFAKYLPVEGKIKEPNIEEYREDSDFPHKYIKDMEIYEEEKGDQQLFLCSRDIKVGDKVYYPARDAYFEVKTVIPKTGYVSIKIPGMKDGWGVMEDERFKVIGLISPEATWVKEGDEFDEDEWGNIKQNEFLQIKGLCGHFH